MHGVDVANRHLRVEILQLRFRDVPFLVTLPILPARAFHEETVPVHALRWPDETANSDFF